MRCDTKRSINDGAMMIRYNDDEDMIDGAMMIRSNDDGAIGNVMV